MNILFELKEAGAHEVVERMTDDLSYDTVRVTLSILEKKGYLVHHRDGRRYIFTPRTSRENASRHAVKNLLRTFFDDSPSKAILTMLDVSGDRLSAEEVDQISRMIEGEKDA
jgi:predicted transcriptional regulator